MTLNVGIAGYGIVGKRRKLCVELHPDLKVKAICDKTFDNTNYDADGINGSAMLAITFKNLDISFNSYIPHRLNEGYGLNKDSIDIIKKKGTKLIITVDCGISNNEEIIF